MVRAGYFPPASGDQVAGANLPGSRCLGGSAEGMVPRDGLQNIFYNKDLA